MPASSLVETPGSAIVGLLSSAGDVAVLLGTTGGNALRARMESFVTRQRAGKQFVSVGEGEAVLPPALLEPNAKEVAALSAEGRVLVFPLDDVKELPGGGKGLMAIKLHEGEAMIGLRPVASDLKVAAIGRGDKRTLLDVKPLSHYRGARARAGRVLQGNFKRVEGFEPAP